LSVDTTDEDDDSDDDDDDAEDDKSTGTGVSFVAGVIGASVGEVVGFKTALMEAAAPINTGVVVAATAVTAIADAIVAGAGTVVEDVVDVEIEGTVMDAETELASVVELAEVVEVVEVVEVAEVAEVAEVEVVGGTLGDIVIVVVVGGALGDRVARITGFGAKRMVVPVVDEADGTIVVTILSLLVLM